MITLSIDVTQLDKARFERVTRKNGNEAVFCKLVLIETPESDFGDYMVKQDMTKEERESGLKMPILGNAKVRDSKSKPASKQTSVSKEDGDEVPF